MVIGTGLIASLFQEIHRDDILFFASGVSNSSETSEHQFKREENLIRDSYSKNPEKLFVYFSTCSIYDSSKNNSPYVLHKLHMEELIKNNVHNYLILRVSNAVGKGGNPNLLMNYLVRSLKASEQINIHKKATRNLIDVEDIKAITLELIESKNTNKIVNIAYPKNYSIPELVEIIEEYFGIKTEHNFINTGSGYEISIPETEKYFTHHNLQDKESYLCKIVEKYYS